MPISPALGPDWQVLDRSEAYVRNLVQRVQDVAQVPRCRHERRVDFRIAYPNLLTLYPLESPNCETAESAPIVVVGKNLAARGIDFYHHDVLPFRRAVVGFDATPCELYLVLNITWSRFLRPGWYDSGGRFTHVVAPTGANMDAGLSQPHALSAAK